MTRTVRPASVGVNGGGTGCAAAAADIACSYLSTPEFVCLRIGASYGKPFPMAQPAMLLRREGRDDTEVEAAPVRGAELTAVDPHRLAVEEEDSPGLERSS